MISVVNPFSSRAGKKFGIRSVANTTIPLRNPRKPFSRLSRAWLLEFRTVDAVTRQAANLDDGGRRCPVLADPSHEKLR